ncbi:MAG: hypothetical protein V4530_08085 [Pseudomonadota bacterium]
MKKNMMPAVGSLIALAIPGCTQSPRDAALEKVRGEIALLAPDVSYCDDLMKKVDLASAENANAEWDKAAGQNLRDVSPEQEQEIRASLGAQLGIPPSKVDWKSIYRSRAEQASAENGQRKSALSTAHDSFEAQCGDKWITNTRTLSALRSREDHLLAGID